MPQIPDVFAFSHRVTDSYLVLHQTFPFEREKSTVSVPLLASRLTVCLSTPGDLHHAHCSESS